MAIPFKTNTRIWYYLKYLSKKKVNFMIYYLQYNSITGKYCLTNHGSMMKRVMTKRLIPYSCQHWLMIHQSNFYSAYKCNCKSNTQSCNFWMGCYYTKHFFLKNLNIMRIYIKLYKRNHGQVLYYSDKHYGKSIFFIAII